MPDLPRTPSGANGALGRFLSELDRTAQSHAACRHAWLDRLTDDDPDGARDALRKFARSHAGFVAWMPLLIRTVVQRCTREDLRLPLELVERIELGDHGLPSRRELFEAFCDEIGECGDCFTTIPIETATWRSDLQQRMNASSPAFGVGALGLGTVRIAPRIHDKVLAALHTIRAPADASEFFRTHLQAGSDPQQGLLTDLSRRLAQAPTNRRDLQRGMVFALEARVRVWDGLAQS